MHEDIPALRVASQFDEECRFLLLQDVVYRARVRLVFLERGSLHPFAREILKAMVRGPIRSARDVLDRISGEGPQEADSYSVRRVSQFITSLQAAGRIVKTCEPGDEARYSCYEEQEEAEEVSLRVRCLEHWFVPRACGVFRRPIGRTEGSLESEPLIAGQPVYAIPEEDVGGSREGLLQGISDACLECYRRRPIPYSGGDIGRRSEHLIRSGIVNAHTVLLSCPVEAVFGSDRRVLHRCYFLARKGGTFWSIVIPLDRLNGDIQTIWPEL